MVASAERGQLSQVVGGGVVTGAPALHFRSAAIEFVVPWPYVVDPRALPDATLQRMVDTALE